MKFHKTSIDTLEARTLCSAAAVGSLDATKTFQTIDALGAASIAWTEQPEQQKASFYDGLVNDLGASGVRGAIMPNFEVANDNNDPNVFDWSKFDSKQLKHVLQFDQRMNERGVKQFFLTVWTPPSWLKTNKADTGGGSLRADMRAEFAEYLAAVVIASKRDFGVDIAGVSIQNEPFFPATFESSMYDNVMMRETLIAVQKKFAREKLSTKVIVNEDLTLTDPSRWLWFNQAIIDDDEVDRSKLIISAHWSDPNSMAAQANQLAGTGIPLWYTEVSGKEGNWDGAVRTSRDVSDTFTRAGASAYYYWTYNNYGNAAQVDQTASLMQNGVPNEKYFAMKHFYKYIRPGMQRIQTSIDESSGMRLSAFRDPKTKATTIVLVNTNAGSTNSVTLNLKGLGAGTPNFRGWSSDGTTNWKSLTPISGSGSTIKVTMPAYGIVTLYNGADAAPVTGQGSPPVQIFNNVDPVIINQLRRAVNVSDLNEVNRLIAAGADVNKADAATGWTALHAAAANPFGNSEAIFDALIAAGANVNAKDVDGFTPLHVAAMNQWLEYKVNPQAKANIVKKLVAKGAQVDARDNQGRTPLMWSALAPAVGDEFNTSTVAVPTALLSLGANRTLKDNAGKTAYDYAIEEYKPATAAVVGGTNTDTQSPRLRFVSYNAKLNAVSLVITEDVDTTLDGPDLKVIDKVTGKTIALKSFTDTFANGLTVARAYFNALPNGQYRLTSAAGAFADRNGKPSAAISYDFAVGGIPLAGATTAVFSRPLTMTRLKLAELL